MLTALYDHLIHQQFLPLQLSYLVLKMQIVFFLLQLHHSQFLTTALNCWLQSIQDIQLTVLHLVFHHLKFLPKHINQSSLFVHLFVCLFDKLVNKIQMACSIASRCRRIWMDVFYQSIFQQTHIVSLRYIIDKQNQFLFHNMFRSIPVANKICFDKDLKRQWKIHQKKLKDLKCSIDFQQPQSFDFLATKPKKQELQDLRNTEILRQNRVLLSKIGTISLQGNLVKQLKKSQSLPYKKTLNQPFRKKCLEQINQQNNSLLRRIQYKKSSYNVRKMAKQRLDVEKNIHLISSFPYKDLKKNKTQVNLWMTNDQTPPLRGDKSMYCPDGIDRIPGQIKRTRKIGNSYFLVTCFLVNHKFTIELENLESCIEKYNLEMNEQQANSFLKTYFGNSIEKMINALSIDDVEKVCYLKYQMNKNQHEDKLRQEEKKEEDQTVNKNQTNQ